jgi:xylulokinase
LWQQILADVLHTELVTVNTTEGAAYGAALLAGVGAGAWAGVDEACDACVVATGRVLPRPEDFAVYDRAHARYRALYPALKPITDAMA